MQQSAYFHPDFMDVAQLLDVYLKEKANNVLIQAWFMLKGKKVKNNFQTSSMQSFSKSNSSYVTNIIPLTTKNYLKKSIKQRFQTAENEQSYEQCQVPSYEETEMQNYSKCQLNQQFEDIVLTKLEQLENDIYKLKQSRAKSIIARSRSKSRQTEKINKSRVFSNKKQSTYTPKYIPKGQFVEKLKIKDITNMIQEQENYSIPQNSDGKSHQSYDKNQVQIKNYLSDRHTPVFKSRGEFQRNNTSEIWDNSGRESKVIHPQKYQHQKTLEQLYNSSQPASTVSRSINNEKQHCQCLCKCCDYEDFPIVKAVKASNIGQGFFRLVPYKFEEIKKYPQSTTRTNKLKFQRTIINSKVSRPHKGIISSFKTPNTRNSFEATQTQ